MIASRIVTPRAMSLVGATSPYPERGEAEVDRAREAQVALARRQERVGPGAIEQGIADAERETDEQIGIERREQVLGPDGPRAHGEARARDRGEQCRREPREMADRVQRREAQDAGESARRDHGHAERHERAHPALASRGRDRRDEVHDQQELERVEREQRSSTGLSPIVISSETNSHVNRWRG